MPINAERLPTTAWLGGQPVTRSEILAWEARRAAKALQRLGGLLPEGDVEPRREAVVEAKLALGRAGIERRLEREVRLSDRATGVVARLSGTRRRVCQVGIFVAGRAVAERLPAWYMERAEANDEAAFLAACPDHHIFRLTRRSRPTVGMWPASSPNGLKLLPRARTEAQSPAPGVPRAGRGDGSLTGMSRSAASERSARAAFSSAELP